MAIGALTMDRGREALPIEEEGVRPGPSAPRWFNAKALGQFLITGGATLLFIPLAYLYRTSAGLERSEYIVSFAAFYAAYVINDPHFFASYLLFYKNARARVLGQEFTGAQRIRYLISGFLVPVLLIGWISYALVSQSAAILGGMIQVMFFLVGWHYVKQGFGVLTVISGRKGVRFDARERLVLLTHCFSGWAYAWTNPRELGGTYQEQGVVYTALKHPPGIEHVAMAVFFTSTVALAWLIFARVRAGRALPPLAASCGFLMSIWLWTVYSGFDPLVAYIIPGLHSLQYWYFVYVLKKNESTQSVQSHASRLSVPVRLGLFFATSVGLAWLGFKGVPSFLDETIVATTATMNPEADVSTVGLGATPFVAAFATFINIHHYFMDHVIWRRENPDTLFLRD